MWGNIEEVEGGGWTGWIWSYLIVYMYKNFRNKEKVCLLFQEWSAKDLSWCSSEYRQTSNRYMERCCQHHQRNADQNHSKIVLHSIDSCYWKQNKQTQIKQTLARRGRIEAHCCVRIWMVQPSWKSVWRLLQKIKKRDRDPMIQYLLLGISFWGVTHTINAQVWSTLQFCNLCVHVHGNSGKQFFVLFCLCVSYCVPGAIVPLLV